jgi:hypothetical protein
VAAVAYLQVGVMLPRVVELRRHIGFVVTGGEE